MKNHDFFPKRPASRPIIYAYSDTRFPGMLKVGYTERDIAERMKEHYPTLVPSQSWRVELTESAMKNDGSAFTDHDVHRVLEHWGIQAVRDDEDKKSEWFKCDTQKVLAAINAVKTGNIGIKTRSASFEPRPEQKAAVEKTFAYFEKIADEKQKGVLPAAFTPKFLWNCKMRFGKTFASYLLAQKMGATRVLVLTFKPAVQSAWQEDLESHVLFEGCQFVCRGGATYEDCDKQKPIVCFGSFQDFLGTNENGGIKARNEWVHTTHWDLVIFDEYYFGAWRENAKRLFENEDEENLNAFDAEKYIKDKAANVQDENSLPITTEHYLFLSGTPFRALNSGEFIEEQIFSWTYSDEQNAKENWARDSSGGEPPANPYLSLPRMVMMTYQVPEGIKEIARRGENNEFDLNFFFEADGNGKDAQFKLKDYVQKWTEILDMAMSGTSATLLAKRWESAPYGKSCGDGGT